MTDQRQRLFLSSILAYAHGAEALANDLALRSFQPLDPTSFEVTLQVFLGSTEGGPVDSFDVRVCTPTWLAQNFATLMRPPTLAGGPVLPGSGLWLMERWDADAIEATIRCLVSAATAPDWKDLANWLDRYIPWEYGYQYDRAKGVGVDTATLYPTLTSPPTDG